MANKKADEHLDQVLQQWETCVEMANNNSDKRLSASSVYMTINVALLAVLTFSSDIKNLLLSVIGITVSIIWIRSIVSYRHLNSVKYQVINELELHLPTKPFTKEWDILKKQKYNTLTSIEIWLPIVFIVLFVIAGLLTIPCISVVVNRWFAPIATK